MAAVLVALACCFATARAEWTLMLRQTAGLWLAPDNWLRHGSSPTEPNYSQLDQLESCRSGGLFLFKVLWPKGDKDHAGPQHNVWRQSSNPLKVGPTEGYVPIDVQRTEHGFGGLTFGESKENKQTLLCNNCDNGNWWHALGASPGPCGAQFPGGGGCTDVAELWCDPGSAWGLAVLGLLVVGGGSYVGGGIALGRRVGGSSAGLQAHPHWHRWLELRGLVHDGVRFAQGSAPLPPAPPRPLSACVLRSRLPTTGPCTSQGRGSRPG